MALIPGRTILRPSAVTRRSTESSSPREAPACRSPRPRRAFPCARSCRPITTMRKTSSMPPTVCWLRAPILTIANNKGTPWPGSIGSQRANATIGVLCRWQPAPTTESGCSPPLTDQYVTNSTCGLSASGTSLVSSSFKPNNGDPLFVEVAIATPDPAKPIDIPATISGCVPSSGPGSWTQVNNGSLFFGSETNSKQGFDCLVQRNIEQRWPVGSMLGHGDAGGIGSRQLKVYDVPGYNGTRETTSTASGNFNPAEHRPARRLAQSPSAVTTSSPERFDAGKSASGEPAAYSDNILARLADQRVKYSPPTSINCENNFCPADDGTDYLSGHGPYSSNADTGHRGVGPGQHALERRGEFVTEFNWGGAAIYIELKAKPLSLACPSSSAQVGAPYASPMVATGGEPDYTYPQQPGAAFGAEPAWAE